MPFPSSCAAMTIKVGQIRGANSALIVIAAQEDGKGIGRIRLRQIPDASAESLHAFVLDSIQPGSVVHTDGWSGYDGLSAKGYLQRGDDPQGQQGDGLGATAAGPPHRRASQAMVDGDPPGRGQS